MTNCNLFFTSIALTKETFQAQEPFASGSGINYLLVLLGKLTPVPKKHSFSFIFPSLNLNRSVFRNNLPSVVQPLYVTKASSPSIIIFSKSNFLVLLAFGQHLSLYSFKLIWSSPAGLVKVNPSSRISSNICQSFFS